MTHDPGRRRDVVRRTAREVCQHARFRQDGRSLLTDNASPREFVEQLVSARKYADAIRVVAHTLPPRAAIWWSAQCLWYTTRPTPPVVVEQVVAATMTWIFSPKAQNQQPLRQLARTARDHKAAQTLALAVTYAGDSLLPELTMLPPRPHMAHRLVATSILLAAGNTKRHIAERQFVELGIQIAQRKNLWWPTFDTQLTNSQHAAAHPKIHAQPVAVA